jgi:2-iminobutanoate/2-iminopropanoate deaminase
VPTAIFAPDAPAANGHYSHGFAFGGLVFTSMQLPIDPQCSSPRRGSFAEELLQTLDNVDAVLRAGGSSLAQTLRVTLYLANIDDWAEADVIYGSRMGDWRPARGVVQVALHMGCRIGADAIGWTGER